MAYKTWAVGDVLTAADMNSMVRNQVVTICTSGTRPGGAVHGKFVYETDTKRFLVANGSDGWTVIGFVDTPGWELTNGTGGNSLASGADWTYVATNAVDVSALSSYTLNPAQVTIQHPGRYALSFGAGINKGTIMTYGGFPFIYRKTITLFVGRSGAPYRRFEHSQICNNSNPDWLTTGGTMRLQAGDVLNCSITHDAAETLTTNGNEKSMFFSGTWIGS